jgi:O-antigen/teichoic acid export membrane protein
MTAESARLDRALVSGMAATAVLRWTSQLISWAGTLFAARLLAPADYGLVAMAMVAIGLARMVEDFGLDAVFVQDRSIMEERQARLAGFVLCVGVGLALLYVALAGAVAAFFKEPQVAWVVAALSLLFVADALQVVPRALLQRDLAFWRLAIAAFLQVVVTQSVLVVSAMAGQGHRSLVFNQLAGAAFVTLLLCAWRPYRVRWPTGIASLAAPLLQGWRVLASRAAYYVYSNADQTIVGRMLGKDALGAYSFAMTFSMTAIQEVGAVVTKVVPGVFSATQDRRPELRRYFLLLTELVAFVAFPMGVGLAVTADLVVELVLGPQWAQVVVPLQILCGMAVFTMAQLLVAHVLMWTGQFRVQMWCSVLAASVMPAAFLIGVQFGLVGVAIAWTIANPLVTIPALVYAFRTIDVRFRDWFAVLFPALTACALMAFAVLAVRAATDASTSLAFRTVAAIAIGAVAYVSAVLLLFRRRVLDLLEFVRARRGKPALVAA